VGFCLYRRFALCDYRINGVSAGCIHWGAAGGCAKQPGFLDLGTIILLLLICIWFLNMLASLIGVTKTELRGLRHVWRGRYYTSSAEEENGGQVENENDAVIGQRSGGKCREEQTKSNKLCQ